MSDRTKTPLIYLITKGEANKENFSQKSREILRTVQVAVEVGIPMIQLREKALSARQAFELTLRAVEITADSKTKLLVNDRADIAIAAGADGVHLTSNSISVRDIRSSFAQGIFVGVSTHTIEEAVVAAESGADFIVFGPVFDSPGKSAVGSEILADVCSRLGQFPVIGLGGIVGNNYQQVLNAGAAGFAAIRWLNDEAVLRSFQGKFKL